MATITNKGTKLSLTPRDRYPDGWEPPVVDDFSDPTLLTPKMELSILRSDVADPDPGTTLDNIIEDATYGAEKLVADLVTAWFGASNPNTTIEFWTHITTLDDNTKANEKSSDFLKDTAVSYILTSQVYIKITA